MVCLTFTNSFDNEFYFVYVFTAYIDQVITGKFQFKMDKNCDKIISWVCPEQYI